MTRTLTVLLEIAELTGIAGEAFLSAIVVRKVKASLPEVGA